MLIGRAVTVLRTGGYLIIDDLEKHFSKEIVHMILELFDTQESNPNGACIIFSTHYAEILDFKISDLFLSNYPGGTAPKFKQIQNLKETIYHKVNRRNPTLY